MLCVTLLLYVEYTPSRVLFALTDILMDESLSSLYVEVVLVVVFPWFVILEVVSVTSVLFLGSTSISYYSAYVPGDVFVIVTLTAAYSIPLLSFWCDKLYDTVGTVGFGGAVGVSCAMLDTSTPPVEDKIAR